MIRMGMGQQYRDLTGILMQELWQFHHSGAAVQNNILIFKPEKYTGSGTAIAQKSFPADRHRASRTQNNNACFHS